jgi:hypothetical protein
MKLNRRADLVALPLDYDASKQAWVPQPEVAQPVAPTPAPTATDVKPARKKLTNRLA